MKVIIITPACNEELHLPELIDSMVNQTFLPSEWIIVDDGSLDNTSLVRSLLFVTSHPLVVVSIMPIIGIKVKKGHIIGATIGFFGAVISLGDIGSIFPSEDASLRGISSMELLKRVDKLRKESNWQVSHVDATIIAQTPVLLPYVHQMKNKLCSNLNILPENINIKATTTDGLGFLGDSKGIASIVIATMENNI